MLFVALAFFSILSLAHSTDDSLTLTYDEYKHVLDEVYHSPPDVRDDVFMTLMWEKIASVMPQPVLVPGCEDISRQDGFACTTEAYIWPVIGKHAVWSTVTSPAENKMHVDVTSPLMFTKPLRYEFSMKDSDFVLPKTPVSHTFEGKSIVKLELEIPDFKQERYEISAQCLVKVKSIRVSKLGKERTLTKDLLYDQVKAIYLYYTGLPDEQFRRLFTLGMLKAMYTQLEKTTWICASEELINMYDKNRKSFEYTDQFHQYCG